MIDRRILIPVDAATGPPLVRSVASRRAEYARLQPGPTLHPSAAAIRENPLAVALIDRHVAARRHRPADWMISLGMHVALMITALVVPLFLTQAIEPKEFRPTMLAAPPGPLAPPLREVVTVPHVSHAPVEAPLKTVRLIAPAVVPRTIPAASQDAAPPDVNLKSDEGPLSAGGMPGGVPGGVLGGVPGGTGIVPAPTASAPVANVPRAPVKVGGGVKMPQLIFSIEPEYPLLAKQAKIMGVVVIRAVIDEHGNVVEAQAISGSGALISAALAAVRKWKYEPTYLNGEPVPLELKVNVTFQLR